MSKPKSLRCRFWGHDMNPDAAHYYAVFVCERCDTVYESDYGLREQVKVAWYQFRYWLGVQADSWRYWWKCHDCGGRFGRHDESQDHLPF